MTHARPAARWNGRARLLAALALMPLLGGCMAAVVAVPAMSAVGVAFRDRAAQRSAAVPAPAPATGEGAIAETGWRPELLPLAELPPPSGAVAGAGPAAAAWQAFVAYALARAENRRRADGTASALLAPDSTRAMLPRRQDCRSDEKAVIIDLDPGEASFRPDAGLQSPPGLANALYRLREAGIVVMWISSLDANRVNDIAAALVDTGLDPTGRDPILLVLGDGDRKQSLRRQAADSACVVAIAGDRREDFDELFGYLRDPAMAGNFDTMLGAGWFLVPAALSPPTETTPPPG